MIILGVESTAHTFGVGIITDEREVLANVKDSYSSENIGMIPNEIVEHHQEVAEGVLKKALEDAKMKWDDIDLIAYSAGPGIDPILWEGFHIAKKWAEEQQKQLIPVNHCAAHLSIGKIYNKLKDPIYLYVSGVNTQIVFQENKESNEEKESSGNRKDEKNGKYHVMGETLDIGLGNMLDKFGRILGLGFPAGQKIEELAKSGNYIELPYVVKGMDVSFSGILTKVQQLFERKQATKEDLCFSIQETCFAMLTEVIERAMAHTGKQELLVVGGVGANQRFCEMLEIMCKERKAKFYKVPMDLAGDQGAMIAWEGFLRKDEGKEIEVDAHWRVDEV